MYSLRLHIARHPGISALALSAGLAGPLMLLLWPWLCQPDLSLADWLVHYGLQGNTFILFAFYFAIIHPALEELHWQSLSHDRTRHFAWLDAAFAGYHVVVLSGLLKPGWLIAVFLILAAASAFWRSSSTRRESIGLAILSHTLADGGIIAAALVLSGAI